MDIDMPATESTTPSRRGFLTGAIAIKYPYASKYSQDLVGSRPRHMSRAPDDSFVEPDFSMFEGSNSALGKKRSI
jgi:hypothetical protein